MLNPNVFDFADPLPGTRERRALYRLLVLTCAVSTLALIGAVTVMTWAIRLLMGGAA